MQNRKNTFKFSLIFGPILASNGRKKRKKKQQRHKNRFWHRLWGRLFGYRPGFDRFSVPGRVPKISQNPKKSIQRVALLSLQKTKRMNFSIEMPPGAILSLPERDPGPHFGNFRCFFCTFRKAFRCTTHA